LTAKNRLVAIPFHPFDPSTRHLGACPRGAMIDS
jgi:hypothetical protein